MVYYSRPKVPSGRTHPFQGMQDRSNKMWIGYSGQIVEAQKSYQASGWSGSETSSLYMVQHLKPCDPCRVWKIPVCSMYLASAGFGVDSWHDKASLHLKSPGTFQPFPVRIFILHLNAKSDCCRNWSGVPSTWVENAPIHNASAIQTHDL